MKRIWKWLILVLVCIVLFSILFRGQIEKIILEKTLPGEWVLLAGGGFDACTFYKDGTVTIRSSSDSEPFTSTWHLEMARSDQKQKYSSHPNVMLVVGDEEYGIDLNLNSSLIGLYVNGKKVYNSLLTLSFSLSFPLEGGGEYVRPY